MWRVSVHVWHGKGVHGMDYGLNGVESGYCIGEWGVRGLEVETDAHV